MCALLEPSDRPNLIMLQESWSMKKKKKKNITSSLVLPRTEIKRTNFQEIQGSIIYSHFPGKKSFLHSTRVNNKSETRGTSFPPIACLINHQITSIPSNRVCTVLRKQFSLWFPPPSPLHLRRNLWNLIETSKSSNVALAKQYIFS